MKVKIYQAGIEAKNKFMDLEFTNRVCGGVNSNDYNVVFDGELPVSNLELSICFSTPLVLRVTQVTP
jgi:hypothetical protein